MIEAGERKLAASNDNNAKQLHQTGECLLFEDRVVVAEQEELEQDEAAGERRYEVDYCSICVASVRQTTAQKLSGVQTEVRSEAPAEQADQVSRSKSIPSTESHLRSRLVVCGSCLSDNLNYCEIAKRRPEQEQQQKVQQKVLLKGNPNLGPSCSGYELEVEWSKPRGLLERAASGLKGRADGGASTKSFKLRSSRLAGGPELEEKRTEDTLISSAIRSLLDSIRSLIGDISGRRLSNNKKLAKGGLDQPKSHVVHVQPQAAIDVNLRTQLGVSCSFESSLSSTSLLEIQRSIDSKCGINLEVLDYRSYTTTPCQRQTSKTAPEKMAATTGSGGNMRSIHGDERVTATEKSPICLEGDSNNNRRSTNSSMGVNEAIFDSSYSSAMNNMGSNNTCVVNCSTIRNFVERLSTWIRHNKLPIKGARKQSGEVMRNNQKYCKNSHQSQSSNTTHSRDHWKNIEFLLAVIGFAVDLGNVWRFPYICYLNGGGAFLIPYTVMFILGGLPIFYLEMSLGQYFSSGCLTVWRRICPIAKGIGYAMCVLNFYTGLFYNTIISWAVFFFVESFQTTLPWTSCNNSWSSPTCRTIDQRLVLKTNSSDILSLSNSPEVENNSSLQEIVTFSRPTQDYFEREVLQIHLSKGIDDLGQIRKPLALYLGVVFICIYFAIWKGVKSTGKAVWITSLLPYFVLIPLLVRGIFLEGSWGGIRYYLYPDWIKILDVYVWVEAAKQIYFSLGPGFGTLMALSSYNKFNHNCKRDALIAATVNYFASFIAGFVIFSVLGYMAAMENVPLENVATDGPGLVFQVYPEGLATMRFSPMWSILFFMMVITLGIDSTFGGLESVITGLCDEYPRVLRANRGIFIGFLIIVIYLSSLPTTTYGGNYVMNLIESYGTTLSLLFIVLAETIVVCWIYGADRFCKNLEEMHGQPPGPYWRICWKYISPTILLLIFLAACVQELDKYKMLKFNNYTYPGWATVFGLFMTSSSVCCIPIYALYHIMTKTTGNSLSERLKSAFRPCVVDKKPLEEFYFDTLTDKITDENKIHPQTVI